MDVNTENVFEREIKMFKLFRDNEENSRINITFNVSSGGITVWFDYEKQDDWEGLKGQQTFCFLIKNFKFDKISYKDSPHILKYKSADYENHKLTCEYFVPMVKFESYIFLYSKNYREYNDSYVDFLLILFLESMCKFINNGIFTNNVVLTVPVLIVFFENFVMSFY